MNNRRALAGKNRPRGLHLSFYAIVWLLVDRYQIDGVWAGVILCLCLIMFATNLYDFFTADEVNLP